MCHIAMNFAWKTLIGSLRTGTSARLIQFQSGGLAGKVPVLTLYTKDPCSLCDDAKEVLQKYSDQFSLEEVDITAEGNEEWKRLYQYDIPVFHLDGRYLMRHRVDERLLQQKLKEKYFI